jgi:hypothetical protein
VIGLVAKPEAGLSAEDKTRETLRSLLAFADLSRRHVQRSIQAHGHHVDVARILRGDCDVKLRPVLAILEVVQLHPMEFFALVFGLPKEPSYMRRELEDWFRHLQQQ